LIKKFRGGGKTLALKHQTSDWGTKRKAADGGRGVPGIHTLKNPQETEKRRGCSNISPVRNNSINGKASFDHVLGFKVLPPLPGEWKLQPQQKKKKENNLLDLITDQPARGIKSRNCQRRQSLAINGRQGEMRTQKKRSSGVVLAHSDTPLYAIKRRNSAREWRSGERALDEPGQGANCLTMQLGWPLF